MRFLPLVKGQSARDYFARFQAQQAILLAEPVSALFLERGV